MAALPPVGLQGLPGTAALWCKVRCTLQLCGWAGMRGAAPPCLPACLLCALSPPACERRMQSPIAWRLCLVVQACRRSELSSCWETWLA